MTTRTAHAAKQAGHPAMRTDRRRRKRLHPPVYFTILMTTVLLTLLGLVMVLSSSSVNDLADYGSPWFSFKRQFAFAAVGGAALFVLSRLDYRLLRHAALPLLAVCIGLLLLVLIPGVGVNVNGSTRWLAVGPLRIQPGELAKLGAILWTAHLLSRRQAKQTDVRAGLRPVIVVVGAIALLLLLQPNLGTTLVLTSGVMVILFLARVPGPQLFAVGLLGAAGASLLSLFEGYRRARLLAFVDPWADPWNNGYQTIQSLVGVASGGLTGVGLGASRAKWGFLPFAHTDFIFAIIAEELGLLGAGAVLAAFVMLAIAGLRVATLVEDEFGMLLAAGITTWFAVQATINIGAVLGLLPITGVPLPFVSAGGSALVVNLAAVGVLLNIADSTLVADRTGPRRGSRRG